MFFKYSIYFFFFFFFNDTATTEIYTVGNTLSLHDALPIPAPTRPRSSPRPTLATAITRPRSEEHTSELQSLPTISYAVFCLKKKKHTTSDTNNSCYLTTNQHKKYSHEL